MALHEVYETPTTTYIVMEICNGGTLQDVALTDGCIPAFQPQEVATVTRRLMRALAYLHDSGIVHRDMKLENVMLKTKGRLDVKICDFGLCAFLSKDQGNMSMVCGTLSDSTVFMIVAKSHSNLNFSSFIRNAGVYGA